MSYSGRVRFAVGSGIVAVIVMYGVAARAQDNPYRSVDGWAQLPQGREWGSTSAVHPARDGTIWVAERCGQNSCVGREDVPPILLFDSSGKLLKSFGEGMLVWPHGIDVDREGNVWVTDAQGESGKGHQVFKFSPDGEVLMILGTAGVSGEGPEIFNGPSDVLVAPNGDIFVADGHGAGGNNRVVKFSGDGRFIKTWGKTGTKAGEFKDPHALAMDSQGRLFVADRGNDRIQIFDQEGKHIANWTQFGRPSGLFIAEDDTIYVADSESNVHENPGWRRGVRIGKVEDGMVTTFIPDSEPDPDNSGTSGAEGVAADVMGNVYGAEVNPRMLRKYVKQ